jgi:serine O-acetyltransferase
MTKENFGCRDLLPKILQSYRDEGGINNIDGKNLPSKQAIAKICMRLLQILFPGYHDDEPLHTREVDELTRNRLQTICTQLHQEIIKALNTADGEAREAASRDIVNHFMGRLPEVRRVLKTDVQAAYEGDPAAVSYEEIILSYPCMEAIAIQRLANILYQRDVEIIPRIMTEWAHSRTGIDIHPGARIGTHFFIDHGTGVVIGETCRIGNHVKLYHGVTLGAKSFERESNGRIKKGGQRHPLVEDGVTIYPNSTILGGETCIGHHSTIGGNVFLMHSVPPHTLVSYEEKQLKFLEKKNRKDASDAQA